MHETDIASRSSKRSSLSFYYSVDDDYYEFKFSFLDFLSLKRDKLSLILILED